jgi:hypothetical protein
LDNDEQANMAMAEVETLDAEFSKEIRSHKSFKGAFCTLFLITCV